MQFYKDYIDISILNDKYICTKLNIENKDKLINNRALLDDEVYIDTENNEIVGIKNRNMNYIVGILDIKSKIKYGKYNNKMLYLFRPTNKNINNFYIPYSLKTESRNIYVIIQFKEWKTTDKLPLGTLIEVIGEIGNIDNEYEHLRVYYNIKNNTFKLNNDKIKIDKKLIDDLQLNNVIPEYNVFSIDPKGSLDIDDAFHYSEIDDITFEFGIHIASPYQFFKNNIRDILERVSTVYLPNKKYNMLPNIYADNLISLLEKQNRYALSIILQINKITYKVNNIDIKQTIVKNIKNYTYENYTDKKIMEITTNFFGKQIDTHTMVEEWMIYGNKIIAEYLIKLNLSNTIIRSNKETEQFENNENDIDLELKLYLNIKKETGALYELYDEKIEQRHSKMNNEYYTHFTSPIRRAIDLYIHGLIITKSDIMDKLELQKYIDKINEFTRNNRRFSRNIRRLEFLNNIKLNNESGNIITDGYIIKITENKLKIYIPEYNLEENIIIIPDKFKEIANIKLEYNYNQNIINIKYNIPTIIEFNKDLNINNEYKEYKLYEKIKIKLWVFMSMENIFDKLKIEILNN